MRIFSRACFLPLVCIFILNSIRPLIAQEPTGGTPTPLEPPPFAPAPFASDTNATTEVMANTNAAAVMPEFTFSSQAPPPGPHEQWQAMEGLSFGMEASYRRALNDDYDSVRLVSITAGAFVEERIWFGGVLSGGGIHLQRGSPRASQAHDPLALEAGLILHYHLTGPKALIQPYLALNFNFILMVWDYRTEIDDVKTDGAWGWDVNAGVGLAVRPSKNFEIFGEVNAGGILLYPEHAEDGTFDSDPFFNDMGYVELRAGVRFVF